MPFEYHQEGIRVPLGGSTHSFPMVTMEWATGVRFDEWVQACCQERADHHLRNGARAWRALVENLAKGKIVHGDLQHENIIVDDAGAFVLVDYDCLAVLDSKMNMLGKPLPEMGRPHYQPMNRGNQNNATPSLDNFSSLVIYVTLLALAADHELQSEVCNRTSKDYLLLCCEDFEQGFDSPVIKRLMSSSDDEVRWISAHLPRYYAEDLLKIPSLSKAVEAATLSNSLDEAIGNADDNEVIRVTRHELYTPFLARDSAADTNKTEAVEAAVKRAKPAKFLAEIVERLKVNPDDEAERQFVEAFDARLIRRFPVLFEGIREELRTLTERLVLTSGNLGLAPHLDGWLQDESKQKLLRASWSWPEARYTDECILAACERSPESGQFPWHLADFQDRRGAANPISDDRPLTVGLARRVLRATYDAEFHGQHGHAVYFEPRYRGWYVAVWGLIDIGFGVVPSHPLVLGQFSAGGWFAKLQHALRRPPPSPTGRVTNKPRGQLPVAGNTTADS